MSSTIYPSSTIQYYPSSTMFQFFRRGVSTLYRLQTSTCRPTTTRFFFSRSSKTANSPSASASSASASSEPPRVVTSFDASTGICTVELNRPSKMNALDLEMFYAIRDAAQKVSQNTAVRVVVLSGRGRAFCTGLDVPSMAKSGGKSAIQQLLQRQQPTDVTNLAQQVAYAWRELPVPVICSLHGMCFGGGLQIALGADLRIATPDCRMSIMEAKWGLIPDMSAAVTLRELIPLDVAKELTWTGRIIDGTEAARLGLVTRVVEKDGDPHQAAMDLAHDIVQRSPDAVASAKELYHKTWTSVPVEYCLKVESILQERLLLSWNQMAASSRTLTGWRIPYFQRKKRTVPLPPPPPPMSMPSSEAGINQPTDRENKESN